jgi:hypothetical protein
MLLEQHKQHKHCPMTSSQLVFCILSPHIPKAPTYPPNLHILQKI